MREILLISFIATVVLLVLSLLFFIAGSGKRSVSKRIRKYLLDTEEAKDSKEQTVKQKPIIKINLEGTKKKVKKNLLSKDKNNRLELELQRAGLLLKPEEYIIFQWLSAAITGGLFILFSGNVFIGLIGAAVGILIPRMIVKNKQRARLKAFNAALPEMISSVIGSLKAGFSISQAFKAVEEEASSPMKEELHTLLREMQYGASMEDALHRLHDRMPSEDLDLMVQAILIQRQVGGNLATVLEKIVYTIRERIKIHGQIQSLTAQGRLSGLVIGLLPVILAVVLFLIEPSYIGTLFTHPVGLVLMVIAVISSVVGFIFIQKITKIEV